MYATWIVAQSTDPISGGAGWIGAGLLGAVLAWLLLKHLPDKDRQISNLLQMKDKQVEDLLKVKNDQLKMMVESATQNQERMHTENQRALDRVIAHCKDEMTTNNVAFQREMERFNQTLQRDLNQLGEAIEELSIALRGQQSSRSRQTRPPTNPQ